MKAIAIVHEEEQGSTLPVFRELTFPRPVATGYDLLVEVMAVSINPVDIKVRAGYTGAEPLILGWDAVGVVIDTGDKVLGFKPGDEVWYAGSGFRSGSYCEFQLVDARSVGPKPVSLDSASAAVIPFTAIAAWKLLFDQLDVRENGNQGDVLLIIGADEYIGALLTQLARKLTRITVIATVSCKQNTRWVEELGAHYVINHTLALEDSIRITGFKKVTHVVSLKNTAAYYEQLIDLLEPQGQLAVIDVTVAPDIWKMNANGLIVHQEDILSSSNTQGMNQQNRILTRIAALTDSGILKTIEPVHFGKICARNIRLAHEMFEMSPTNRKIVLEGF